MKSLMTLPVLLAFGFIVTASPVIQAAEGSDQPRTVEIHEIKQGKLPLGAYLIKGYVAKVYVCPPCPPPNLCKPCMRDNIVVSERKKRTESYSSLGNQDLIVFAPTASRFTVGRKYTLIIRITGEKSTSEPIGDVHLDWGSRGHFATCARICMRGRSLRQTFPKPSSPIRSHSNVHPCRFSTGWRRNIPTRIAG